MDGAWLHAEVDRAVGAAQLAVTSPTFLISSPTAARRDDAICRPLA